MKFRHQVLHVLPVVMLACSLLPAPARAQFTQQGPQLIGTGAIGPQFQGSSVSLSGDGDTAIIGGAGDNGGVGATWVFARSDGVWTQQGPKLVGTGEVGPFGAGQGYSVALSADGNTAIVGGPGDDNQTGAAWVFTRSDGVWSQQAKLVGTGALGPRGAVQGQSVSLSGDGNTAIVGGPGDGFSGIDYAGAAWVFTRSGGVWSQQAKLVGTGAVGGATQGISVSLSGDGNTAIVGGGNDNRGSGEVGHGATWVFTRSDGVWTQQAKLVGTSVGPLEQGVSVSLSSDGSTAIAGGPLALDSSGNVGATWVFTRSHGLWNQQAILVGTGAVGDAFQGLSVSLAGDGNTAIVGGPGDDNQTGAAWVFTRSDGLWTQLGSKLVASGQVGQSAVSLSGDGSTAIISGLSDNGTGGAWVFVQPVFAGTPGKANCHGKSVSALARQYGGLNGAAAALGYADVSALQEAILAFCGG
jgi:hypothetical protein